MQEINLVRAFLHQNLAKGSRSTVLKPLGWMITICISATLYAAFLNLNVWIVSLFAVFCGLTMLLYLGAYIYCLLNDKDALRSETYTIQKMAIEKGFIGDSLTGILPANEDAQGRFMRLTHEAASEVDK